MRKTLATGLVILLPVALTLMIFIYLFDLFTAPFAEPVSGLLSFLQTKLSFKLPSGLALFISRILSLLFICLFILILGVIARWFLIRNFLSGANHLFSRIPLIKTIYKLSRDIISALFSAEGKKVFKYPVQVPIPHKPTHSIGFKAGDVAEECQRKIGAKVETIFAPTAPHPITGFLLFIPEKDVKKMDMSNEDAVKFLVSCGMIQPNQISITLEDLE